MISRILTAAAVSTLVAGTAIAQTATTPAAPSATAPSSQPPFVVPFLRGGTSINDDMMPVLDRAVAYAQSNSSMGVVITGIADARGSDSARANRARAMANSVRSYLRDRGVPESRSRTAAEGDAAPTAVNRVEITFVAR